MGKDYKNNFLKRSFTASFLAIGIVTLFILDISAIIEILLIFLAIIAMREVAEINKSSCRGIKTSYIWLIVLSLFLFYFVNSNIVFGIYIHLSSLFWLIFSIFLFSNNFHKLKFISFQNSVLIQFLLTSFIISILFVLMLPQIFEFKNSIFIFRRNSNLPHGEMGQKLQSGRLHSSTLKEKGKPPQGSNPTNHSKWARGSSSPWSC